MISASLGQLASQLNLMFASEVGNNNTATSFDRHLSALAPPPPEGVTAGAFLETVLSGGLDLDHPLAVPRSGTTDWRQYVYGRTEHGKYEYMAVPPSDQVTADGYRAGLYRHQLAGFSHEKMHPTHPDAMNLKYVASRVFEQIDVFGADPLGQAVAIFNELGIPATRLGKDKIDFGNGETSVDVIGNMTEPGEPARSDRTWQWLPT